MKKYMQWVVIPALVVAFMAPTGAQAYTTNYQTPAQQQQIAQLYALVAQLQAQLNALLAAQAAAGSAYVSVETGSVSGADNDGVEMAGVANIKRDGDVRVWFEYGLTTALSYSTQSQTLTRTDAGDRVSFSFVAPDLDNSKTYYYRAVAEGRDDRFAEGAIKSFRYDGSSSNHSSHSSSNNDEPEATTDNASSVDTDSAKLAGRIDMNDFENGIAFLVYGESKSDIEDVEDADSYNDVDTNGDDLRKVLLSSNLDTDKSFTATVSGLNDDTKHYYRFCVEYENDDNDTVLVCGDVESFETDRD